MDSLREQLDRSLDAMIGNYGLAETVRMLNALANSANLKLSEIDKHKLILRFLTSEAILLFEADPDLFSSPTENSRDAKKAIVHLLNLRCKWTWRRLGVHSGMSLRQLRYNRNQCAMMLSTSGFYSEFVKKYKELESKLMIYMTKIE